jgi:hypothetical protein
MHSVVIYHFLIHIFHPPSPHPFQCWRRESRHQIFVCPTLNWGNRGRYSFQIIWNYSSCPIVSGKDCRPSSFIYIFLIFSAFSHEKTGTRWLGGGAFSYTEPFLRAVNGARRGTLAKSIFRTGIWLASSNTGHCMFSYHFFVVSGYGFSQSISSHRA